jgi:hypothetical protein
MPFENVMEKATDETLSNVVSCHSGVDLESGFAVVNAQATAI